MITENDLKEYKGDKRSKEYKMMKEEFNSQEVIFEEGNGLGDKIESVLEATGIAKVAKAILGDNCGCAERKRKFNEARVFVAKQQRCFTDDEAVSYGNFMETRTKNKWSALEVGYLFELYAEVFGKSYNIKRMCGSCMGTANILKNITKDLDEVFKSINN